MKTVTKQPMLVTTDEAAEMLGISKGSMKRAIKAGALKPVRIVGLGWPRYRRADVEAIVRGEEPIR